MKTVLLTTLAMLAFAANSLLCRWALGDYLIDAASFANIRALSGAVLLALLVSRMQGNTNRETARQARDWTAAISLFVYLVFFSFAYLTLEAGTGALILFGAVQLTMFLVALSTGERFGLISWIGFFAAIGGFIYLLSPGLTAPPLIGGLLMGIAGIAWGVYSLRGRDVEDAVSSTRRNFALAVPLTMAVNVIYADSALITWYGALIAVASGALASALGYVVWYSALRGLSAMSAATVQLSVPLIAAIGGVLLLAEAMTLRLSVSSIAILGGIAIVLSQRGKIGVRHRSRM